MVRIITEEQFENIIDTRIPAGSFLLLEKGSFIGIDNTTGDAWVEDFRSLSKCLRWLHSEDLEVLEGECGGI